MVSNTYDAAGRLSTITNGEGRTYFYTYDTSGRRNSLSLPNGAKAVYSYDSAGHLTKIAHISSSGSTIASFRYTLDKTGNRLSKSTPDTTVSYEYDALYRLTQALSSPPGYSSNSTGKGGGIPNATLQQKELYVYDPVGNRLSSDRTPNYLYNEGNQLISNGETYVYDKNGNLVRKITSEGTTVYIWNYENRLLKVTASDGTVTEFRYDPFGRRISKRVSQGGTTTSTRYFYDERNLILEYDDSGKVVNKYIYGTGELVAVSSGKDTYFYHADGLGSVVTLTDQGGKVVQTYDYDSFGNMKDRKNRIKQSFTYTGREWDKEPGLYLMGARYYDPMEGRFLSKDPIGFESGDVNLYAYVGNNVINKIDPSGLSADEYEPDIHKHGGPHIDRYDASGKNVGRYRPDGTGIPHKGKMPPPIPKKDMCKFLKAVKALGKLGAIAGIVLELATPANAGDPSDMIQCCDSTSSPPTFDTYSPSLK